MYLCKYCSIFFQILICFTWEYSLQMQWPRIFILTKTSWRIFAIKGGMFKLYILRVFSMGHDFFWKLDSTFSSLTSNISVVLASFSLSIEYVVAETISYHKCDNYFSIICRDHAHISDHLNRPRDDLNSSNLIGIAQTLTFFLFLPYTFLCTRLLEIDKVNFLRISVSHQALWFQV